VLKSALFASALFKSQYWLYQKGNLMPMADIEILVGTRGDARYCVRRWHRVRYTLAQLKLTPANGGSTKGGMNMQFKDQVIATKLVAVCAGSTRAPCRFGYETKAQPPSSGQKPCSPNHRQYELRSARAGSFRRVLRLQYKCRASRTHITNPQDIQCVTY
jgi:hypothetical protein